MSQVSGIIFVIGFVFVFVIVIFVGQVRSPHNSDQMSQRSQVSRVAPWRCFLNVFVFVIAFFLLGPCPSSPWSNVLKVTSLQGRYLKVFSQYICLCHCLCVCPRLFSIKVMSPHHSDQISQRSQASRVALGRCSLNVFVFFIVFVFVFVFVIVFLLVRPCSLITLTKCLKGH